MIRSLSFLYLFLPFPPTLKCWPHSRITLASPDIDSGVNRLLTWKISAISELQWDPCQGVWRWTFDPFRLHNNLSIVQSTLACHVTGVASKVAPAASFLYNLFKLWDPGLDKSDSRVNKHTLWRSTTAGHVPPAINYVLLPAGLEIAPISCTSMG